MSHKMVFQMTYHSKKYIPNSLTKNTYQKDALRKCHTKSYIQVSKDIFNCIHMHPEGNVEKYSL